MIFDIEKALIQRLDTGSGIGEYNFQSLTLNKNIPVFTGGAIDNRSESESTRIELYFLDTDLVPQSNCTNEQQGTVQFSVFVPDVGMAGTQAKIIGDLVGLYSFPQKISINDTTIYFQSMSFSRGRADGKFYRRDISSDYKCYLEH